MSKTPPTSTSTSAPPSATEEPRENQTQQGHAAQREAGAGTSSDEDRLQADALELLLRSPRLNIDTILRLLDIDEREFRALVKVNPALGGLLKQRSQGLLELPGTEPRKCPMCREWFLPYAGDRLCSDECKAADKIDRRDFREESRATASD